MGSAYGESNLATILSKFTLHYHGFSTSAITFGKYVLALSNHDFYLRLREFSVRFIIFILDSEGLDAGFFFELEQYFYFGGNSFIGLRHLFGKNRTLEFLGFFRASVQSFEIYVSFH